MAPTEIDVILLAGLIIFSGHFVKGVSGFGSALFAVPLLMFILDIKFVTPVFLVFDFISGVILVAANWRSIHRRLLLLLLCGLLVGTAVGTWVLLSFGHDLLKRILGVLVAGWALSMILRRERSANPATRNRTMRYLAPLSGFLGGALGAMFSVNGPPIIIYLSHVLEEKQVFRATLYGIFFADACYKVVLFTANRLLTGQVLRFALLMAPFLVAGALAGSRLQKSIDQVLFRRIVALILVVTGIMLIV
jgi:uncharacterized membrane protein YfcA